MKRYSPLNRDSVHADMRADPVATRAAVRAQPGVREAHRGCEECERLDPLRRQTETRRQKVVLTLTEVASGLPLPPDARPVRMYVEHDPQYLCLIFESDSLEPVPLDSETPIALLADEDTISVE
ncbi:hypothetical protein [Micromonospora sp. NPDC005652]|uniref:hypothetical protein n=1 Tax=Micromonospora sp. NPDC005652 TaxID=3157046 RepID=UPI0033C1C797